MIVFLFVLGTLVGASALFLLIGARSLNGKAPPETPLTGHDLLFAAVLVPAAGRSEVLRDVVLSLVFQDYPSFQVVFVVRDKEDPATEVIQEAVKGLPHALVVFSGRTVNCGQKNHNLLKGLDVIDDRAEVLVFCDSTRIAPNNWLSLLLAPLAGGEAKVASGYHHILPEDARIPTLGHACSVLVLYLTKGFPFLNQAWGGGTAIQRDLFDRLGVREMWSKNVVDDVSLAALLKKNRIRTGVSPGASMSTPVSGETVAAWNHWFFRQWFGLKVCFPGSWLMAGLACHAGSLILLLSLAGVTAGITGLLPPIYIAFFSALIIVFISFALALRALFPGPAPWLKWVAAAALAILTASWSHLMTVFTMTVEWKDIRYQVGWAGTVKRIEELRRF